MSQYSEMMGSFIRTGNYPLEADYIFPNEAALKEYYSDPLHATILHKGLFKIVENDGTGKQGLYWVSKKLTNDELEFTRLISGSNIQSIDEWLDALQNQLDTEIENRKKADTAIWGTNDPTNVIEQLNSLTDISEAIIAIKEDLTRIHAELVDQDDSNYNSLKTELKATAGTLDNDIVEFLKTLPYKSLTEVSQALNKFLNTVDNTTTKINTLPELLFFLEGYTDSQKLRHVLMDLQAAILGDPLPTEEFRTLRGIEDFIRIFNAESEHNDENIQGELNQTQIGVGLNSDGSYSPDKSTNFLQDATSVMNALKTLDSLVLKALQERPIEAVNNDIVDLNVRKELEGYKIGAKLNLSNVIGNDLIKKEDGLYYNADLTYKEGVLSLVVNGKVVATHVLGFSSLVESAVYDPSQEAIIIVFKLLNGDKQTITIPVGALIREWQIDNDSPDKVVELTRTTAIDGPDELSADVRLYADRHNILVKRGNTLFVDGQSDNITHNDQSLASVIEFLKSSISDNVDQIEAVDSKIDAEIARATNKEIEIELKHEEDKLALKGEIQDLRTETAGNFNTAANNLAAEVNRATLKENALSDDIKALKDKDAELEAADQAFAVRMSTYEAKQTQLDNKIDLEAQRAKNVESGLNTRVETLEVQHIAQEAKIDAEVQRAKDAEVALEGKIHLYDDDITALTTKVASVELVNAVQAGQIETLKGNISTLTNSDTELTNKIAQETTRATGAENLLNQKLDTANGQITNLDLKLTDEIARASAKEDTIEDSVIALDGKVNLQKAQLEQKIHEQADAFEDIVNQAVSDVTTHSTTIEEKIDNEILRSTSVDEAMLVNIDNLNDEISKKIETVELVKDSDLVYSLKVDGTSIGTINIPQDQFLEKVELVNNGILKFTFNTTAGVVITEINLSEVIQSALTSIQQELTKKAPIESPTFTGIPQVMTSPDAADASQRIPSTNWVRERIEESIGTLGDDLTRHLLDFGNPHRITAAQIGVYSKTEADAQLTEIHQELNKKATLSENGKIPAEQLPEGVFTWLEV